MFSLFVVTVKRNNFGWKHFFRNFNFFNLFFIYFSAKKMFKVTPPYSTPLYWKAGNRKPLVLASKTKMSYIIIKARGSSHLLICQHCCECTNSVRGWALKTLNTFQSGAAPGNTSLSVSKQFENRNNDPRLAGTEHGRLTAAGWQWCQFLWFLKCEK